MYYLVSRRREDVYCNEIEKVTYYEIKSMWICCQIYLTCGQISSKWFLPISRFLFKLLFRFHFGYSRIQLTLSSLFFLQKKYIFFFRDFQPSRDPEDFFIHFYSILSYQRIRDIVGIMTTLI